MNLLTIITLLVTWLNQFITPLPPPAAADLPRLPPREVKAIYVTAQTAKLDQKMTELRRLIKETELNAVVINTKEPSGPKMDDELKVLIDNLHAEGVWVIARQVVFQDDDLAKRKPEYALKKPDGSNWLDRGGNSWLDPSNKEIWQYNLDVAQQAVALGFDEINLDYIRFPTDGDLQNIVYPTWDQKTAKEEVLRDFLRWFRHNLRAIDPYIVLSIDIYGETFLGDFIGTTGQSLKILAPEVDVVAPMIYPSHYRTGNFGYLNPAAEPYGVVYGTLSQGKTLLTKSPRTKVRPWLQDFNLGAYYTPDMVRAQIQATYDAGYIDGWMLWNAQNIYSSTALNDSE